MRIDVFVAAWAATVCVACGGDDSSSNGHDGGLPHPDGELADAATMDASPDSPVDGEAPLIDLLTPMREMVAEGAVTNAIAVDSLGVPHVVYAAKAGGLYYATRGSGGTWTSEAIDAAVSPGQIARLAFDGAGTPHVLYRNATTQKLEYATKDNGTWTTIEVDSTVNVNTRIDLALDGAGMPHAVFQNLTGPEHGYARWTGSAFATEAIPSSTGVAPSIVIDKMGKVVTAEGGSAATLFTGSTGAWTSETYDAIAGTYEQTDLAIDAQGDLHIVYVRGVTRYYSRRTGTTWSTPVAITNVLNNAQVAVDSAGHAYVAGYAGGGSPLYLGRFEDGTWTTYKVDSEGNAPTIAFDAQNRPHLSYTNRVTFDIWYATY